MGKVTTYVRTDDGVLYDRTADVANARGPQIDLEKALVEAVEAAAEAGMPFTLTGKAGLFQQAERLPEQLRALSRHKLERLGRDLLDAKRIKQAAAKGSNIPQWLDVPGGKFARGEGEFAKGAPAGHD
jgi:hypothetical protein